MRKSDPILMAAKDAFIESGFGNTSMDDVARRASTTKRTVYNNFGSKERLLEAVIDHSILLFETAVPPLGAEADPGQIRAFHLRPIGEVLDRAAHRGAETLLAHQARGLPHRLDRF